MDCSWGDKGVFRPREVGPRGVAAEAPWRLGSVADVPDSVLEAGRVGGLEVRAASTRGSAHRFDGDVRQDAVGVTALEGRQVIAAVADGVGAATESHHGARLAVRHALGYLAWALPGASLDGVDVGAALHAADRAVHQAGPEPVHRSTTLTVAVVEVTPVCGVHPFRVARVGDSPAFVLGGGQFKPLFDSADDGAEEELADPRTDSLPRPEGPVEQVSGLLMPGEALVLASDGVGVPVRETEAGDYLAHAWSEPPGPVTYLHQLQFNLKSFDDDRTAVGIWACHEG